MALEDAGATKEKYQQSKKKLQQNKHGISKFHTMNLYSYISLSVITFYSIIHFVLSHQLHVIPFILVLTGWWWREREVVVIV